MISHVQVFLIAVINSSVQSDLLHLYTFRHIVSEKEAAHFGAFQKVIHKLENRFVIEL
jgi:hypothetical protein